MKKVDVSIITPFYNGNEYMERLIGCVRRNAENASHLSIELILVNDSPDCDIVYEESWIQGFGFRIVTNEINQGIQRSRINGIRVAEGKYILMLDQDDLIADHTVRSQLGKIGSADIIVSNGCDENPEDIDRIYRTTKHQKMVSEKWAYLVGGGVIVSPGQCVIKKESIPEKWYESCLKSNGADDLLLWYFMLHNNAKWAINEEMLYTHCQTGKNVSGVYQNIMTSAMEVLEILKEYNILSAKEERIYIRRYKMLNLYRGKGRWRKYLAMLCYPDIGYGLIRMRW